MMNQVLQIISQNSGVIIPFIGFIIGLILPSPLFNKIGHSISKALNNDVETIIEDKIREILKGMDEQQEEDKK